MIGLAAIALTSSFWVLLDVVSAYRKSAENFGVPSFEARFEPLRKVLPARAVVGYISDNAPNDTIAQAEFYLTQYVLAPSIVTMSAGESQVVGNFHSKPDLARLKAMKLGGVHDFGNYVYLFRSAAQ